MKNNNFKVSFKLNKKDLSKFTDYALDYLDSQEFRQIYDFDYKCSKLVLSSRYLFEFVFYDLKDSLSAMIFISTIMCQAENYCVYPVELAHVTFNCLNKD